MGPRRGLSVGERNAENGVGAQALLVLGAIELAEASVEPALVIRIKPGERLANLAIDGLDRLAHALAAIALAAVAKLMGFMRAGGGAGRHGGAAEGAVSQCHIHFDGRVAAAVDDFPADDGSNCGHGFAFFDVIWGITGSKRP